MPASTFPIFSATGSITSNSSPKITTSIGKTYLINSKMARLQGDQIRIPTQSLAPGRYRLIALTASPRAFGTISLA